jgi:putative tryptophan/tyrosine transport system substrate-binding protein
MKRRAFIRLLGGAIAASPFAARAQQPMPVVGFLYLGVPELSASLVAAFRKGLSEAGFVEGRSVAVEYRFAYHDPARLPELAADLVRRRVAVIATPGGTQGALAAKAATTTIPVVFSMGGDPVELGFVASINRPGGNVTGISSMNSEVAAKRLGVLHELLPKVERLGALISSTAAASMVADLKAGASAVGRPIELLPVATNRDIDAAFATLVQKRVDALVVNPFSLVDNRRVQVVTLAVHHRVPTMYAFRDHVEAGGLMSYGSSATDRDRQVGIYVGRILKGERPGDLPVIRATKFELVVNLQTARTLGIEVPPTLLAQADEVIE